MRVFDLCVDAGGPGCGRQTVCQQIIELRPEYKYISAGQLLKDAVEPKTPELFDWSEVQQNMDAGEFVEDVSQRCFEVFCSFFVFVVTELSILSLAASRVISNLYAEVFLHDCMSCTCSVK